MFRYLLAVMAVLLVASPAWSAYYNMGELPNQSGYRQVITSTMTTDDYIVAPAKSFQRLGFTKGSAFEATVYACETNTYAAGTCTSVATLSASTASLEVETGRLYLIFDVTTAETGSNVSYITIQSNRQNAGAGGGGGGVLGSGDVADMEAYAGTKETGDLFWVEDDADGNCTGSDGPGTTLCAWNGAAWEPAGSAGAGLANVVEDLTPQLGGPLDGNAKDVTNVASLDGSIFFVTAYASGSDTGGIQEALDACETAGGGTVMLPAGNTAIDATAISSPIISMPFDTDGAGYALCSLVGHGDALSSTEGGGSTITISNLESKVGIHATSSRQIFRDFTLKVANADATTVGILWQSEDTAHTGCTPDSICAAGEAGINNFVMENVSVSGPAAGGPGVGVEFQFTLKGRISGGEIQKWDTGVHLAPVTGLTGTYLPNAANIFSGTKIRENDDGFVLSGYASACSSVTLTGLTIEGNEDGLVANANSDCFVNDIGTYYEQSRGTQANRRNIGWDTTGGNYYGLGPRFSTSGVDAGRDFVASANQFANYGPHIFIGALFGNGITSAGEVRNISPRYIDSATVSGSGIIHGALYTHATDCPTWGASSDSTVAGDACWEQDANTIYICEPDADGVCDDAAEWISQKAVDYVWTGAHDFGGATLEVPNSGTLPATCTVGQVYMDTDATSGQRIYACESTNTWALQGDGGAGGGAPTDADYLVGTANGSLSAEIVVGTSPGGELGGTWASPTLDDSVTVNGWTLGSSSATTLTVSGTPGINSNGDVIIRVDEDANGTNVVSIQNGADTEVVNISEAGAMQIDGDLTVSGTGTSDFGGAVTATSFTADASATPQILLQDSTTSGETSIEMSDAAGPDGVMMLKADQDGTLTTMMTLSGITNTITFTAPPDLPDANGADADSTTAQSDSGLELVGGYLTLLRGCADNEILKWDETQDDWNCEADSTGSGLGTSLSSSTNDILSGAASSGVLVLGGTGGTDNENLSFDFEATSNAVNVASSTGVTTVDFGTLMIDAPAKVASSTGGTLATNTITLATAAGDYDLPDECDSATGVWATIIVRDASETVSITTLDTSDVFSYKGIATLVANDEMDSPGAALDSITFVCMAADSWIATANSGSWTDGGTAD